MESKYSAEMMEHLEKQKEILMDAYRSMSLDLRRLQVEEDMLMRKFYEIMSPQGVIENENGEKASNNSRNEKSGDSICEPSNQI